MNISTLRIFFILDLNLSLFLSQASTQTHINNGDKKCIHLSSDDGMPLGKRNCNEGAHREIRIQRAGREGGNLWRSNKLLRCTDGVSVLFSRGFSYSTKRPRQSHPRLLSCHHHHANLLLVLAGRAMYSCMVTKQESLLTPFFIAATELHRLYFCMHLRVVGGSHKGCM
jgi:hypothetical protein